MAATLQVAADRPASRGGPAHAIDGYLQHGDMTCCRPLHGPRTEKTGTTARAWARDRSALESGRWEFGLRHAYGGATIG